MLVGIVGGLLLSSQSCRALEPSLGKGTPASLEIMQRVRDEHALVAKMIKVQLPAPLGFREARSSKVAWPHLRQVE